MSAHIVAGDLVMVVRKTGCCGSLASVGSAYIVLALKLGVCPRCGMPDIGALGTGDHFIQVNRLIKIDPPAEPETVEHEEEITA